MLMRCGCVADALRTHGRYLFQTATASKCSYIHVKFNTASGESICMLRTPQGLVRLPVVSNRHWIPYLLTHATGSESWRVAEGQYKTTLLYPDGGKHDFLIALIYVHDGIKLTISNLSS